jgi:hypothetical protein
MTTILQRFVAAIDKEYERRIRAASLVTEYGAEHVSHGHFSRTTHVEDAEGTVIANVTPGTQLGRLPRRSVDPAEPTLSAPPSVIAIDQQDPRKLRSLAAWTTTDDATSPSEIAPEPEQTDLKGSDNVLDATLLASGSSPTAATVQSDEALDSGEAEISNIAPGSRRRRIPPSQD